MKINWKSKLSSRKFWALLGAVVISLLTAFNAPPETIEKIMGAGGAVVSCIIYMLAEAVADSGRKE